MTRLDYRHVASGDRYNPKLFGQVTEEAFKVFLNRDRGQNGFDFRYHGEHPLTVDNMREICYYIDKIWNDEEIYLEENK